MSNRGWVYVIKSGSMPGILKIGMTRKSSVEDRVKQLNNKTAVPSPFKVVFKVECMDAPLLEKFLHKCFAKKRMSGNREFFRVSPDVVREEIKRFLGDDGSWPPKWMTDGQVPTGFGDMARTVKPRKEDTRKSGLLTGLLRAFRS